MKLFLLSLVGVIEGIVFLACGYTLIRIGQWLLKPRVDARDQVSEQWLADQEIGRRW
jgi:hypothetical protein